MQFFATPPQETLEDISSRFPDFPELSKFDERWMFGLIIASVVCGIKWDDLSKEIECNKGNVSQFKNWLEDLSRRVSELGAEGLPMLTGEQVKKITDRSPKTRGKKRVDDQKLLSGGWFKYKTGCRWKDIPSGYGNSSTIKNRFACWSQREVFDTALAELAIPDESNESLSMDSTCLKNHRTATNGKVEEGHDRIIGKTVGGLNTKLHTVCEDRGRPVLVDITEGQENDVVAAKRMVKDMPRAKRFIADKAYDSKELIELLREHGFRIFCIPKRRPPKRKASKCKNCKMEEFTNYDDMDMKNYTREEEKRRGFTKKHYKTRHKVENFFCRLKDYRGIAFRYCRRSDHYLSAIKFAIIIEYW